jgi:hypothetical protein
MTIDSPRAQTTRVVLLGASEYRKGGLRSSPAFAEAAASWRKYFVDADGYGLTNKSHLKSFFDEDFSSDDMLEMIAEWIRAEVNDNEGTSAPVRDLFVCYVGHGVFDDMNSYCLAIRRTREESIGSSSIRIKDLAVNVSRVAETLRVYLILDACFSGSAPAAFMSGASQALGQELRTANFPEAGVSLLCSSSHDLVSHLIPERNTTLFSEAALKALRAGNPQRPGRDLSLREVKEFANRVIASTPKAKKILSVTHSPRQTAGDLASIPLFPNRAVVEDPAGPVPLSGIPDGPAPDDEQQESAAIQYTEAQRQQVELERNEAEVVIGRPLNWHLISFWLDDRIEATTKEIAAAEEERQEVIDQLKNIERQRGIWNRLRSDRKKVLSIDNRIALTQMAALKDQIKKINAQVCKLTISVQVMHDIQKAQWHGVLAAWLNTYHKTFKEYVENCLKYNRLFPEHCVETAAKAWSKLTNRQDISINAVASTVVLILLYFSADYVWWAMTNDGVLVSTKESSVTSAIHSWEAVAYLSIAGIVAMIISFNKEQPSLHVPIQWRRRLIWQITSALGITLVGLACITLRYVGFSSSGEPDAFRKLAGSRFIVWLALLAASALLGLAISGGVSLFRDVRRDFLAYWSAGSPGMRLAARRSAQFQEP